MLTTRRDRTAETTALHSLLRYSEYRELIKNHAYQTAMEKYPELPSAYYLYGTQLQIGDKRDILQSYYHICEAIKRVPYISNFQQQRATLLKAHKQLQEITPDYENVIKDAEAIEKKLNISEQEMSVEYFKEILEYNSDAVITVRGEDQQFAFHWYFIGQQSVKFMKKNANKTEAEKQSYRYQKAAAIYFYELAVLKNPNDFLSWNELARIFELEGNVENAKKIYRVMSYFASNPVTHFHLGMIYHRENNHPQAKAQFFAAIEASHTHHYPLLNSERAVILRVVNHCDVPAQPALTITPKSRKKISESDKLKMDINKWDAQLRNNPEQIELYKKIADAFRKLKNTTNARENQNIWCWLQHSKIESEKAAIAQQDLLYDNTQTITNEEKPTSSINSTSYSPAMATTVDPILSHYDTNVLVAPGVALPISNIFTRYRDLLGTNQLAEAKAEYDELPHFHFTQSQQYITEGNFAEAYISLTKAIDKSPLIERSLHQKRDRLITENLAYFKNLDPELSTFSPEQKRDKELAESPLNAMEKMVQSKYNQAYLPDINHYVTMASANTQQMEEARQHVYRAQLMYESFFNRMSVKDSAYRNILIFELESALLKFPQDIFAWNQLAIVLMTTDEKHIGELILKQMIALYQYPLSHIYQGLLFASRKDYASAKQSFITGLKLAKDHHYAMFKSLQADILSVLENPDYFDRLPKLQITLNNKNNALDSKTNLQARKDILEARNVLTKIKDKFVVQQGAGTRSLHYAKIANACIILNQYEQADANYAIAIWIGSYEENPNAANYKKIRHDIATHFKITPTSVASSSKDTISAGYIDIDSSFLDYRNAMKQTLTYMGSKNTIENIKNSIDALLNKYPQFQEPRILLAEYLLSTSSGDIARVEAIQLFRKTLAKAPYDLTPYNRLIELLPAQENQNIINSLIDEQTKLKKEKAAFIESYRNLLLQYVSAKKTPCPAVLARLNANPITDVDILGAAGRAFIGSKALASNHLDVALYHFETALTLFADDVYSLQEISYLYLDKNPSKAFEIVNHLIDEYNYPTAYLTRALICFERYKKPTRAQNPEVEWQRRKMLAHQNLSVFLRKASKIQLLYAVTHDRYLRTMVAILLDINVNDITTILTHTNKPDVIATLDKKIAAANAIANTDKYVERVQLYSEILKLNPTLEFFYRVRGKIYFILNNYEAANKDFAMALALAQLHESATVAEHDVLLQRTREELTDVYNIDLQTDYNAFNIVFASEFRRGRLVSDEKLSSQIETQLGNCNLESARKGTNAYINKDYEAALEHFQSGLSLSPIDVYFLNGMGMCEAGLGNIDKAMKLFNQTIEIEGSARGYYERGKLHSLLGNTKAARADYIAYLNNASKHEKNNFVLDVSIVRFILGIEENTAADNTPELHYSNAKHDQARQLFESKQYATIVDTFTPYIPHNLQSNSLYSMLAQAKTQLKSDTNVEEAQLYTSLAIWYSKDKYLPFHYSERAMLNLILGRTAYAIDDYLRFNELFMQVPIDKASYIDTALSYFNNWVDSLILYGCADINSNDRENAKDLIETAILYHDHCSPSVLAKLNNIYDKIKQITIKTMEPEATLSAPAGDNVADITAELISENAAAREQAAALAKAQKEAQKAQAKANAEKAALIKAEQHRERLEHARKLKEERDKEQALQAQRDEEAARLVAEEEKAAEQARKQAILAAAEQKRLQEQQKKNERIAADKARKEAQRLEAEKRLQDLLAPATTDELPIAVDEQTTPKPEKMTIIITEPEAIVPPEVKFVLGKIDLHPTETVIFDFLKTLSGTHTTYSVGDSVSNRAIFQYLKHLEKHYGTASTQYQTASAKFPTESKELKLTSFTFITEAPLEKIAEFFQQKTINPLPQVIHSSMQSYLLDGITLHFAHFDSFKILKEQAKNGILDIILLKSTGDVAAFTEVARQNIESGYVPNTKDSVEILQKKHPAWKNDSSWLRPLEPISLSMLYAKLAVSIAMLKIAKKKTQPTFIDIIGECKSVHASQVVFVLENAKTPIDLTVVIKDWALAHGYELPAMKVSPSSSYASAAGANGFALFKRTASANGPTPPTTTVATPAPKSEPTVVKTTLSQAAAPFVPKETAPLAMPIAPPAPPLPVMSIVPNVPAFTPEQIQAQQQYQLFMLQQQQLYLLNQGLITYEQYQLNISMQNPFLNPPMLTPVAMAMPVQPTSQYYNGSYPTYFNTAQQTPIYNNYQQPHQLNQNQQDYMQQNNQPRGKGQGRGRH